MPPTDPTTNITGNVDGIVLSGSFTGPLQVGDTYNVDTGGGDYAEGNIDKRTIHEHHYATPRPAPPPAFQVPYPPNPLFVGRDAPLAVLEQMLTENTSVVVAPVIAGMGLLGVGFYMTA